jgi:hypothetical protein
MQGPARDGRNPGGREPVLQGRYGRLRECRYDQKDRRCGSGDREPTYRVAQRKAGEGSSLYQ